MEDNYNVVHNTDQSRFEVQAEGKVAELNYVMRPGRIIYTSTHVPRALEGRGVGSALVKTGLEYARLNQLSVVPNCSFVRSYLRRHPEYADLTAS